MTGEHWPLHVEVRGKQHGPTAETFLLIHGFGASKYSWRHWVGHLEARGRVLLVDMKGFGSAGKPDDPDYGPVRQAELIEKLVASESPTRLTLIGHSLGGGVALLLASSLSSSPKSCLERLVVVAGAAYPQRLPPFVTLAQYPRLTHAALRLVGSQRTIAYVLRSIVYDTSSVELEQIRAYADPLTTAAGVRALLRAATMIVPDRLDEITAGYPAIDVPALLLWGRHDRVVPLRVGERLSRALPRARLEVMERCGHIPHEERPRKSLAILEAFLESSAPA